MVAGGKSVCFLIQHGGELWLTSFPISERPNSDGRTGCRKSRHIVLQHNSERPTGYVVARWTFRWLLLPSARRD